MGDTGMNLLINMRDDGMPVINRDVTVIVGGMELEDETVIVKTSETGTIVYRNFSCQADIRPNDGAGLPVIFCGLFSPACDAMTQCDIPLKVGACECTHSGKEVNSQKTYQGKEIGKEEEPHRISNKSRLNIREDLLKKTIEEVIRGVAAVGGSGNGDNVQLSGQDSVEKDMDDTLPAQGQ